MHKLKLALPTEVTAARVATAMHLQAGDFVLISGETVIGLKPELFQALYGSAGIIQVQPQPQHKPLKIRLTNSHRKGSHRYGKRFENVIQPSAARKGISKAPGKTELEYLIAVSERPGMVSADYCYAAEPSKRSMPESERSAIGTSYLVRLVIRGLVNRSVATFQRHNKGSRLHASHTMNRKMWVYEVTAKGTQLIQQGASRLTSAIQSGATERSAHQPITPAA